MREELSHAIATQRFALIIDSTNQFLERYPNERVLLEHYRIAGPAFEEPQALVPRSGWQVGPGRVWVPKHDGG